MANFINESTDPEVAEILRNVTETSQQEAVTNIERANHIGMSPDNYSQLKDSLEPEIKIQERVPAEVDPSVKKIMQTSQEMTNVITPEIGIVNKIAKHLKSIKYNLIDKRPLENEIMDFEEQYMDGLLDDNGKEYLDGLYDMRQEEVEDLGLSAWGQVPGQAAGVVGDFVETAINNKELIMSSALFGGALGAVTPVPGGTLGGAVTGAGIANTAAMMQYQYRKMKLSMHGELRRMTNDDGVPLNLPEDTMKNLSIGYGVAASILEGVTGGILTKGLGKLGSKSVATQIVKNPSLRVALDVFGLSTKVAMSNAGEEVSSEILALAVENYAQGEQGMEGAINALHKTAQDLKNPEVLERLTQTAVVGAVAGKVMTVGTAIPVIGAKKAIYEQEIVQKRINKINEKIDNSVEVVNNQTQTLQLVSMMEETGISKVSPNVMDTIIGGIVEDIDTQNRIWFSKSDMEVIAEKNPELAERIEKLDVTEASNNKTGSPVGVVPHQYYALIREFPSLSEYARLNPEAPNPLESKNFLERIKVVEAQRQELLGSQKELTPEQIEILTKTDKDIDDAVNLLDVRGYIENPVFTDLSESVLPRQVVEGYSKAQTEARLNVLKQVEQEFQESEQIAENAMVKEKEKLATILEIKKLSKNLEIVEKFRTRSDIETHKKKGYSKLAIDPNSLPANLKEAYITDPKLIKRKVFVEGGISLEESAALAGVENGQELLKILANAPDKKELVKMRKDRAIQFRSEANKARTRKVDETRKEFFDKLTDSIYREMQFMKDHKWTSTKQGIKTIALPMPKIPEIQNTARIVIANTKVGELNPRQYLSGEAQAQKRALNHILKNETLKAFTAKEQAILNNELTRSTIEAKARINNAKNVIKRITSKKGKALFKKAKMSKDINQILELFDLTDSVSKKKKTEQEAFLDYIKALEEIGESDLIPESLSDIRQRGSDLTVEQFLRITETLQTLEHQAKMQNKLFKQEAALEKAEKVQTEEAIVEEAVLNLKERIEYDESKLRKIRNKDSKTEGQKVDEGFSLFSSMFANFKNIAFRLDGEKPLGLHTNNLVQPMNKAENYKRSQNYNLLEHVKNIAKDYGKENFEKAFNDFIEIEEFKGYDHLGNGNMVKTSLWTLLAYLGDPQGRERIQNFKSETGASMTIDLVKQVLEKHLTVADAKVVQNFVNIFKTFEEDSKQLHFRTTGVMPNMVKGVPIEFKGIVMEGGYVPNNYLNVAPQEKTIRFLEGLGKVENLLFGKDDKDGKLYSQLRAMEQTEQGRLIDRTGSSLPLDTSFSNFFHSFEEIIHDLAYREAGADTLKLLKNPAYSEAIIATVGEANYKAMTKAVIETVGQVDAGHTLSPFNEEITFTKRLLRRVESGFSVAALGFNISSILMQPLSFGAAALRMGPNGNKYLLKSLGNIVVNMQNYKDIYNRAIEINPDILFGQDSIDDMLTKSTYDQLPETKRSKYMKPSAFAALRKGHKFAVDTSMAGLKHLDIHIKVAVTMAAYAQFIDGNVEGFSLAKLEKMTEKERDTSAKKYVKQISDLALTTSATIDKSGIEKIEVLRLATRFYTDRRSQLNTLFSQGRRIKESAKGTLKAYGEGDSEKAMSFAKKGAIQASSLFLIATMMRLYEDLFRREQNPIEDLFAVRDFDDFKNYMFNTTVYVATSPANLFVQSVPLGGDIRYMVTNRSGQIGLPLTQTITDVGKSILGLTDLLQGEGLSDNQKKSLLFLTSIGIKGLPVYGPRKIMSWFEESEVGDPIEAFNNFMSVSLDDLGEAITIFTNKHEKDPNYKEFIEDLKEVQKEIIPAQSQSLDKIIPENAMEVLKTNNWNDRNPDTGATGIYQFTEERWQEIMDSNPDLGITDEGRDSKDTKEQEIAMKWSLENNAMSLINYQVPVTIETLYGAHRFGADDYAMVYESNDSEKLSNFVQNPELFKGFITVKQVKNYIKQQVKN